MVFRQLAKDTVLYGGADFVSKLVLFLAYPVVAAVLNPRAFGALELIGTSTTLLGLIINCGLNNATQRFYWDVDTLEVHRPTLVSSGLFALVGFGVIGISVGILSIPLIVPLILKSDLPLTRIALGASLVLMGLSQWLQFVLDVLRLQFAPWRFMVISMLFRIGGAVVAVVTVAYLGWGIDGLLSAQASVALLVLPLALYFIRKDLTLNVERSKMSELVRFGYPFIFMSFAYWLLGSMDRWMLACMSSVEEVGIYSIAFRYSTIVLFISVAFGQAWSPVAIKIHADDPDGYRQTYVDVLITLLYVMFVVGGGLALFSGELIHVFMPKEYVASALPLAVLCFGVVVQSTQQVTAIGISLARKTILFARLAWVAVIINFFLNLLAVPSLGALGAALATMISQFVLTCCYLCASQALHPLPIPWNKLLVLLFGGGGVGGVAFYYNSTEILLSNIVVKMIVLCVFVVLGWTVLPLRRLRS